MKFLQLLLLAALAGFVAGFGCGKGVVEIKPYKIFQGSLPPSEPAPVNEINLKCQNITLAQVVEKGAQQINLGKCPRGTLKIYCSSVSDCDLDVSVGDFRYRNRYPRRIDVIIEKASSNDILLSIIASKKNIYTLKVEFIPSTKAAQLLSEKGDDDRREGNKKGFALI